jgi:uncharacterized integral membrane protein
VADEKNREPSEKPPAPRRGISPEFVVAIVVAALLVVFIVQNSDKSKVTWLVKSTHTPLWAVIFVSAVVGYLLGQLVEYGLRRRRRHRAHD